MGVEDRDERSGEAYPGADRAEASRGGQDSGEGGTVAQVLQHLEVTEPTYYRWRNQSKA